MMRRIPSFSALRAFEAAARLGGFALACEELRLTPSAISHQVRALERHFGRALFVRGSRKVTLTPDGERLLAGLSTAFDALEAACDEFNPPAETQALAVHCTPSFAAKWLGPRLPGFLERHPSISIRLSSGAGAYDLLRHDETDVAIAYGAATLRQGLASEALGEEEIAALSAPGAADRMDLTAADAFERTPLLESSVSPVRWSEWFALNAIPTPSARAGSAFDRGALVISAAAQGLGIALETLRFAEDEIASGQLVKLGDGRFHSIRREMHFLSYRQNQKNLFKIRTFRDWLVSETAPDAPPRRIDARAPPS